MVKLPATAVAERLLAQKTSSPVPVAAADAFVRDAACESACFALELEMALDDREACAAVVVLPTKARLCASNAVTRLSRLRDACKVLTINQI